MDKSRPVSGKIRMQAARWLIELEEADEITAELMRSFEAWLSVSPVHRETYVRIEQSWREVTRPTAHMVERSRLARARLKGHI